MGVFSYLRPKAKYNSMAKKKETDKPEGIIAQGSETTKQCWSNFGRPRIFSDPMELWDEAVRYFEWCDNNPWYKNELLKGGEFAGTVCATPTARPYTISGLCVFIGISRKTFTNYDTRKEDENTPEHINFLPVTTRIKDIIYTQKFEGAAVGSFQHNIIAMDLGLTAKQDLTTDGKEIKKNTIIFGGVEIEV